MKLIRRPTVSQALLAIGLLTSFAAAHAAPGYTVTSSQESQVTPGMTMADVQAALGTPAENSRFNNESGPTLTYRVAGVVDTLFDVDFDANGRVASVDLRKTDGGGTF